MSLLSVVLVAAAPHNSDPLPWQTSLSTCWTNASCNRALLVGHGGDPNFVTLPYGSLPSFERAVAVGADAVKGDYRAAEDGLGVVVHSSPIEIYESLDCAFHKPEKMAAAKVADCAPALFKPASWCSAADPRRAPALKGRLFRATPSIT